MADQVRSYSATDNVTWILGRHTLKAGVDAQTDSYLQVNHNRVGNFSYSTDTKNPNNLQLCICKQPCSASSTP